jgi:hypothetical protein
MAFYLYVVFALLITYKSLILSEHHIDFVRHGVALISALALAKVMLTAQELHLAEWFGDAPLIYPTFVKSLVFTIVLACFKVAEEVAVYLVIPGRSLSRIGSDMGCSRLLTWHNRRWWAGLASAMPTTTPIRTLWNNQSRWNPQPILKECLLPSQQHSEQHSCSLFSG